MWKKLILGLLICLALHAEEIDRRQIAFLMQCNEVEEAISIYQEYRQERGKHDFEILQQMGTILLEQGAHHKDQEIQLLSMFGAGLANYNSSIDVLETGILSKQPETQMASIQYLGKLQDDRCDELLIKAMASPFLFARIEACFQLAMRKHKAAAGQVEALMHKLPRPFWSFFPQFFALIGTPEAINVLRHLIDDRDHHVRIEAINSAAQFGRDDLLIAIRAHLTHSNPAEQEACAKALGQLRDSKSVPKLKKLCETGSPNVKLAAALSLYHLGEKEYKNVIHSLAKEKDPFAVASLGAIPGSEELLKELLKEDEQTKLNSTLSLLHLKDPACVDPLCDFILRDTRDLGFQPHFSLGKALLSWKVIPSLMQHAKNSPYDLQGISLNLREKIMKEALELPEPSFLKIVKKIFSFRQRDLIPLTIRLLENLQTENVIALLETHAKKNRDDFIRTYCNLALYRLHKEGPYAQNIRNWIDEKKEIKMFQFRPAPTRELCTDDASFELTPEESARLLIESYLALASKDDPTSLDALLNMIQQGEPKNRYALAGILIAALQ